MKTNVTCFPDKVPTIRVTGSGTKGDIPILELNTGILGSTVEFFLPGDNYTQKADHLMLLSQALLQASDRADLLAAGFRTKQIELDEKAAAEAEENRES